jgi:hypothetical protein
MQSGSHEVITPAPGFSLIVTDNCLHLEGWSVLQVSLFLPRQVLVPCHKDVFSAAFTRIQGDHKVTVKKMA